MRVRVVSQANAHAAVHAPDQCVLKEIREPLPHGRAVRALVQLHPDSQDAAMHARDGVCVTDRLFSFDDLIGIVDEWEASQKEP